MHLFVWDGTAKGRCALRYMIVRYTQGRVVGKKGKIKTTVSAKNRYIDSTAMELYAGRISFRMCLIAIIDQK